MQADATLSMKFTVSGACGGVMHKSAADTF